MDLNAATGVVGEMHTLVDEFGAAQRVWQLDPLGADGPLHQLRRMNARADLAAIVNLLRDLLPTTGQVARYTEGDCLAVMRDLGLLLGSTRRHGVEPVEAVPRVEPILVALAARTHLVPRDTLQHYVMWSAPEGVRARMYTGDPMEAQLKAAVRVSMPPLAQAIRICARLRALEPSDHAFTACLDELTHRLAPLATAITAVLETVTPEYFARALRPYFEPVRVNGTAYLGPAAAHLPLPLIDLTLWASDRGCAEYEAFWRESIPYTLPMWRDLFESWAGGTSLVTRVAAAWAATGGTTRVRAATAALARALRCLVAFRGRHLRIARPAYRKPVRLHPVGSGGATVEMLATVLQLTRDNANLVRRRAG
jgi:hypothetical protein